MPTPGRALRRRYMPAGPEDLTGAAVVAGIAAVSGRWERWVWDCWPALWCGV
jgi:hypothetical protein